MLRPLRALLLAAVLAPAPAPFARAQMMEAPPPPMKAGTRAPAFDTQTLDGRRLSLKSLRGKVVLLDFWATWCGPCRIAMPTLQRLHRRFHQRGLRVVGLSVDEADSLPLVRPTLKQLGVTYTVSASPAANIKAAARYRADIYPTQYLIDKKGVVRWSQVGFSYNDERNLRVRIGRLLAEKG